MKSVAEDLATDEHKVRYRNPVHFSGPGEFRKADKVFVFGDWPEVVSAAKQAKVKCKSLEIPEEPSDETGDAGKEAEKDEKSDNDFDSLPEDTEFPYNYGGNWYFLSDGSKVQGEGAAIEAQEALDETGDA